MANLALTTYKIRHSLPLLSPPVATQKILKCTMTPDPDPTYRYACKRRPGWTSPRTLTPLTGVHVSAGQVELSPEELHAHDGTEDDEEKDKNSHVHEGYECH